MSEGAKSQASVPRSRPAGGRKSQQPACTAEDSGVRRSTRGRSNVAPTPPGTVDPQRSSKASSKASSLEMKPASVRPSGGKLSAHGDLLAVKEYQCLLQMLCPDFPMDVTQKAARIVLMDDAMDCLMSFCDFLYAFQIQFFFSEFLDNAAAIYQDLLTGKSINTVIVPTSRSAAPSQRQPYSDGASPDGVDAPHFYQCLESLCERERHSASPPLPLIGEILSAAPRLTFYGFLMALSKNAGINQSIGALPDKADLLVDEVLDKELDRIVAQLSACAITHPATASLLPPSRDVTRVASPKKMLPSRRRPDLESDGSTEETEDSSDN